MAELLPDSRHINMDRATKDKLIIIDFKRELVRIKNSFNGNAPSSPLNVFYGPMAYGSAVVASNEVIQLIKSQARKVVGLDMESYGVYLACRDVCYPSVNSIVIKSISDFANRKKDDFRQDCAAYTSTSFAMYLIQNVFLSNRGITLYSTKFEQNSVVTRAEKQACALLRSITFTKGYNNGFAIEWFYTVQCVKTNK